MKILYNTPLNEVKKYSSLNVVGKNRKKKQIHLKFVSADALQVGPELGAPGLDHLPDPHPWKQLAQLQIIHELVHVQSVSKNVYIV